jgi:long-chain acyl-CoA synthetase
MIREPVLEKGIYPAYPADPISDIREIFRNSTRSFPDKIALQSKIEGRWVPITYGELRSEVELIACGLAALGLQPSSGKLAIVGDNRPEWAISYLAAACTGIVCVPIDKDLKETEVYSILYLSGAQAVIGDEKHMAMLLAVRSTLPGLRAIIHMDEAHSIDGILSFSELRRLGQERKAAVKNDYEERTVSGDHILSILFTSGTMGNSKGVMLTHANVASNLVDAVQWVNLRSSDRFLSVLPIHHSYECTDGFLLAIYAGATVSYAENLRRLIKRSQNSPCVTKNWRRLQPRK